MKAHVVVGGLAFGILLAAGPASAQVVQAGVVFRSGPVAGHVIVGEPGPVAVYPRPRRIVVVERYAPRVVVVERIHVPPGHAYGWHRYGYRPVVVYYDRGRYYDRAFDGRPLRRVEVYQRGGRYYRWDGDDRDHYRDRYREAQRYGWDD